MKDLVRQILTDNPATRDSNIHLASVLYEKYIGAIELKTAAYLLRAMYKKEVPTMDSISRCSRILQEKNPDLRGKEWDKRQANGVDVAKGPEQLFN